MKIIRDQQLGTLTLVTVDSDEERIIAAIAAMLQPEDKLSYGGRSRDGEDGNSCAVHLHAGGRVESQSKTSGCVTLVRAVHVDSVELVLRGTTEEDKHEVWLIRDMCVWGFGGLIFLGTTEVDGKKAIITTGMRCKHCGAGMIRRDDCEWSTCDACAAKCEHNYIRGAIHGGKLDIGIGNFCDKCGRTRPTTEGEKEMSEREHHSAVEQELGIKIINVNPHELPAPPQPTAQ